MNQDPRQQDIPQMNSNNKQTAKGSPNKSRHHNLLVCSFHHI